MDKKVFEIGDEVLVKGTISMKNRLDEGWYYVHMPTCSIWLSEKDIIPLPHEPKED